jgi:hypothetical protein
VAAVFSSIPLNIFFQRRLMGNNLRLWHSLVALVVHIRLNGVVDSFIWGLHQNGKFYVNSMYNTLIADTCVVYSRTLWRLKIPPRIKILMWYFKIEVVLTEDNLARRNWDGNTLCSFCSQREMIQHLFSIVILLDSYGEQCKQPLTFQFPFWCHISLMIGLIIWGSELKNSF